MPQSNEKKELKDFEIMIPHDWEQFIRTIKMKNKYINVEHLMIDDIKDFVSLVTGPNSSMVVRRKDETGAPFLISKVVWMRFEKEKPGKLLFKTSFDEEDFTICDLSRKRRQRLDLPETIPPLRTTPNPIKTSKYKNLLQLLPWVPERLHDFYKKIRHNAQAAEIPVAGDDLEAENDNV